MKLGSRRFPLYMTVAAAAALTLAGCANSSDVATAEAPPSEQSAAEEVVEEEVAEEEVVEEAAPIGTREVPLPIGSTVEDGDWKVTLNSVTLDATEAVAAENAFNEPAPEGYVYVLANLTIEYMGSEADGTVPMLIVEYVTTDGNTRTTYDDEVMMTVAPDALDTLSTMYGGASLSGNLLFSVPAATAGEGVFAIQPDLLGSKTFVAAQ